MGITAEHLQRLARLVMRRPKGWRALAYNTAMAKLKRTGPLLLPVHISIEPTNACNLRCPVCETGNGSLGRVKGIMDPDVYKAFIDEVAPTTSVMMFYFMGEPFLNKHAYEMIRYARQKDIYVETCTNGDFVNAEGVIYSDINEINFQIGGLTQPTHDKYRVRGDLERTLANLDAVLEARRKAPGSNVQVNVGFIVMKHNEDQVPEFMRWAKAKGIDRANIIDPCVRSVAEGRELLPRDRRYWFYDEAAFEKGVLKPKVLPDNECTWIWNSTVINVDGTVVPCCRDPRGKHIFGNAFERPLKEIWNNEAIRAFRRRIVTEQGEVDICKLCSGYGVPNLMPSKPMGTTIKHHTVNQGAFELPAEAEAELTAR
jgi:radical SAM protein with 4Fe4S-binding SPASM domain